MHDSSGLSTVITLPLSILIHAVLVCLSQAPTGMEEATAEAAATGTSLQAAPVQAIQPPTNSPMQTPTAETHHRKHSFHVECAATKLPAITTE